MRRHAWRVFTFGLAAALYAAVAGAGFLAPYHFASQNRALPHAPPTRVHLVDAEGRLRRPFVYPQVPVAAGDGYREDRSRPATVRLLAHGEPYRLLGLIPARRHLFGVDEPARIFVLGSDAFGRDLFSRLLYGGFISVNAGLLAAALALGLGSALGLVSGYYGGWVDALLMRGSELFLALPWLYLLLAVRAVLPLTLSPAQTFLLLVSIIGLVGWARPARLVRGVVLSARERDYVRAARGFGASGPYVMRRHLLPETGSVVLTQAALLAPRFVLAEVTLSFLGLGVAAPQPSWGNLLAELERFHVLDSSPWMIAPAGALVLLFLTCHALARAWGHDGPRAVEVGG